MADHNLSPKVLSGLGSVFSGHFARVVKEVAR